MIKLHAELAEAALKQGVDREYRVWALARSIDVGGSGKAPLTDLQQLIRDKSIRGLSPRTLKKVLQKGEGVFWVRTGDGSVWLSGLGPLCFKLGIEKLRHAPTLVGYSQAQTLKKFRAACYSARFPNGDAHSRPISRKTLTKLNGKTGRTQRSYDKVARVERKNNRQVTGMAWKKGDANIPEGYTVDYVDGELQLLKYMPNSYRAPSFSKAPRGMIRNVNKYLKAKLFHEGEEQKSLDRLYYGSDKSASKRRQSGRGHYYVAQTRVEWPEKPERHERLTTVRRESRGGAALWSLEQHIGGAVFCS